MSKVISLSSPVAVVAHDAGGASILASYVEQEGLEALFVLTGPAEQIFRQRFGRIRSVPLPEALAVSGWVLTGSGGNAEWCAIRAARAAGKYVVTFLDHWTNYEARFVRNSTVVYPDEIWVGDAHALMLAKTLFKGLLVYQVDNPYFKYFVDEVKRYDASSDQRPRSKKNILYVTEPIQRDDFHQNEAIRYLMNNLDSLGVEVGRFLLRPHPSESAEKYTWVTKEFDGNIEISRGASLQTEVADSDIVVGCTTMAMALALMAGRRVVSCIPENTIPLTLPFRRIEKLRTLIERKTSFNS